MPTATLAPTRRGRLAARLVRVANPAAEAANRLKKLVAPGAARLRSTWTGADPIEPYLETVYRNLLACDPTPRGKYVPWLAQEFNAGHAAVLGVVSPSSARFRLPEDAAKLREAFGLLERFRTSPALRGVNVMALDWFELDRLVDRIKGESGKEDLVPREVPGLRIVHDDGVYRIYMAPSIRDSHEEEEEEGENAASEAGLRKIGLGTKWCTRDDYEDCQAGHYLKQGHVFVVVKGGRKLLQFSWGEGEYKNELQAMDTQDRPFDFGKEPRLKPIVWRLIAEDFHREDLADEVQLAKDLGWAPPDLEENLVRGTAEGWDDAAELLARHVENSGRRTRAADAAMLQAAERGDVDPYGLLSYMDSAPAEGRSPWDHRWPEAEPFFARDANVADSYARSIRDRFPAGEAAIAADPRDRKSYAGFLERVVDPEAAADFLASHPEAGTAPAAAPGDLP